jgi:TrmH family RNA methyltransferase
MIEFFTSGNSPAADLAALPRRQQLRKICKIFTEAERRMAGGELPGPQALAYLGDMAELAATAAPEALAAAAVLRKSAATPATLRAINTIRHILLAETGRFPADWDFIDHAGKLDPSRRRFFEGMSVYLEDIRSPYNVGAMFRTAESFGAARLYLSPLCANPRHPRAERTAMGCTAIVPWETQNLPQLPGPFFALETGGTALADYVFPARGTIIVGNEELGISPQALALADASLGRVSIPSYGAKASLNVSVAFGVVMQAWAAALLRLGA